jgi:hypothetical protein
MPETVTIRSVEQFIPQVREDTAGWPYVWFRGEPGYDPPLLPRLYRSRERGGGQDENQLLQLFRMKAPILGAEYCPDREATDQWLFLAQHVGLPTRLLDWTESALAGLYFALWKPEPDLIPAVWMLDPLKLNQLSVGNASFPLTWVPNIESENINAAWTLDQGRVDLPVAILPTNIHPRMSVQRSCFTVHGRVKDSLAKLIPEILRRYDLDLEQRESMLMDLRKLGISHSTLFPDLEGLAKELTGLC